MQTVNLKMANILSVIFLTPMLTLIGPHNSIYLLLSQSLSISSLLLSLNKSNFNSSMFLFNTLFSISTLITLRLSFITQMTTTIMKTSSFLIINNLMAFKYCLLQIIQSQASIRIIISLLLDQLSFYLKIVELDLESVGLIILNILILCNINILFSRKKYFFNK